MVVVAVVDRLNSQNDENNRPLAGWVCAFQNRRCKDPSQPYPIP